MFFFSFFTIEDLFGGKKKMKRSSYSLSRINQLRWRRVSEHCTAMDNPDGKIGIYDRTKVAD